MNAVKFIDRPCGTGKTTRMINSFCPTEQYLVVVPTLSEVQRVLRDSRVPFTEPDEKIYGTKMAHFERLVAEGENIVTTHKLFDAVDIRSVDLADYNLFIDAKCNKFSPAPDILVSCSLMTFTSEPSLIKSSITSIFKT